MSGIDNELFLEAEENAQEVEFIKNYLPQELKEKFSEDDIYYIIDVISEYYVENGIFDNDEEDEEEIEIDLQPVVDYIVEKAKKENIGEFDPDEVLLVVQADLDFYEDPEESEE
jgi:hypothetical protein